MLGVLRYIGIGVEDEVTTNKHIPSKGTHDRFRLYMEVPCKTNSGQRLPPKKFFFALKTVSGV